MAYGAILGQTAPPASIDSVYQVGDTLTTLRSDLGENWVLADGRNISEKDPISQVFQKASFDNPNSWSVILRNQNQELSSFSLSGQYLCVDNDFFYIIKNSNDNTVKLKCIREKIASQEINISFKDYSSGAITWDYKKNLILYCGVNIDNKNKVTVLEIDPKTLNIQTTIATELIWNPNRPDNKNSPAICFHVGNGYYIIKDTTTFEKELWYEVYFSRNLTDQASAWVSKMNLGNSTQPPRMQMQFSLDGNKMMIVFAAYSSSQTVSGKILSLDGDGNLTELNRNIDPKNFSVAIDTASDKIVIWKNTSESNIQGIAYRLSDFSDLNISHMGDISRTPAVKMESGKVQFIDGGGLYEINPNQPITRKAVIASSKLKTGFRLGAYGGRTVIDQKTGKFFGCIDDNTNLWSIVNYLPTITNPENVNTFIKIK